MSAIKIISKNKKAFHNYEILEKLEAGIVLQGCEVKSIKKGDINLKDSYARISSGEMWLYNCHISPYTQGNIFNDDPTRTRKLLLHKKQINKFIGKIHEKGLTLIPLAIYLKKGIVKVELGLGKAKKLYDKRKT